MAKFSVVTDPQNMFDLVRQRSEAAISSAFPVYGQRNTLDLEGLHLGEDPDVRDVSSQLGARLNDTTWGAPLMGSFVLRDAATGKVKQRKDIPLAILPKMTSNRGFIVDGKEYYVDHLWRTKPGVYVSPKARGVVGSFAGASKRHEIILDPQKKEFKLRVGTTTVPLVPVMQALGVSKAQMVKAWGQEIAQANEVTAARARTALTKLQRALGQPAVDDPLALRESFESISVDPDVTERTLGKKFKKITPDALLATTEKVLSVSRGKAEPDDRDSLRFKELIGLDDHLHESLARYGKNRGKSLRASADRHDSIENIVRPFSFHPPIRDFFGRSALSQIVDQTSPVEMSRAAARTTIIGEGMSTHALETGQAKAVNPSHVGFVDPVDTPEGSRAGINLQLTLGAVKDGTTPRTLLYNLRTKKHEYVDPATFESSTVALPDQYRKVGKKWEPVSKRVRVSGPDNKLISAPASSVDYIIPNPNLLLGVGTALVPFVQNVSPNRLEMASRHLSQALPLVHREAPLVQVATGTKEKVSFEEIMGKEHLPLAPVAGKVISAKEGEVKIQTSSGKVHTVQLFQNYPLTGKREVLHEEPLVKKGDTVKAGQPLADSNFTRKGTLAIGTNLLTALIPIPGRTYEDALVVSENGAKKLVSEHMHKVHVSPDEVEVAAPKKFQAYYPTTYTGEQLKKVDATGVVKPGTEVNPGDPLVLGLREQTFTNEAQAMKKMHRSLARPYTDQSIAWESDYPGRVVRVHRTPEGAVKVHVRTQEPLEIGDKLTTRFGVKGVVVDIRPNDEMPHTKDGKVIELAINPHSIAARMTPGQVYELATSKVAEKRGSPVHVPNFLPETDYGDTTREALKKLNISDQEEIVDPKTGKTLGKAMTGKAFVLKQKHQVDRKMTTRASGPGFTYDVNRQPKGGSQGGGQTLGGLGNMALLAHGSRELLREAHTYKVDADQADELWRALQLGQPIPPPRLTFAHKKFENYAKALGLKIEKNGTKVRLTPMLDKEIVESTKGEIEKPGLMFRAEDMSPEKGGLFDPQLTGGISGEHASRIRLAERMPNPVFEKGILALTGLKEDDFRQVLSGKSGMLAGQLVDRSAKGAVTGSKAIEQALEEIDLKKEMAKVKAQLPNLSGAELDRAAKKFRYLNALHQTGLSPTDAYMTKFMYVLPPSMRPVNILPSGAIIRDSVNELYKGVGIINERLQNVPKEAPEGRKGRVRLALYDSLGSFSGMVDAGKTTQGADLRGVIDVLKGTSPKYGFFQAKLLKSRQDLSARSTIVPDPDLTLDEIGVPLPIASTIYRPFIVRELTRLGHGALKAQEMVKANDPTAVKALERVMKERPLLMKRDPVLHKYGVMAFRPKLMGGRAIRIPPLITSSMGADFDGDAVSLYAPVSNKAVAEAKKMYPSENLLNPSTGKPVFTPSNEMSVGLYRLSLFGEEKDLKFKDPKEAADAVLKQDLKLTDVVSVGGKKTTVGRLLVWKSLPEAAREERLLSDPSYELNSGAVSRLLTMAAKKSKDQYVDAAQTLMHLGNAAVYNQLFSVGLEDFKADKDIRKKYFDKAQVEVAKILATKDEQKEQKALAAWVDAGKAMVAEHEEKIRKNPNNLYLMTKAGVKPSPIQYQQMNLAPVLMVDHKGNPVLEPVGRSYSEGLDAGGFWLASIGARTGLISKGMQVQQPGYLNKQMVNTVANSVVVSDQLPTEGISMDVDHPDVADRYLTEPVRTAKMSLPKGTLLTPELVDRLKNAKVKKVVVASPLTSPHGEGISSKSYGLMPDGTKPQIGDNLGVIAGQSIGERLAQLMLKSTHTGGVYDPSESGSAVRKFGRIKDLLRIPEEIKDPATLATVDGKVKEIREESAGGWNVIVGGGHGQEHELYVPSTRKLLPGLKVGAEVRKGRPITDGNVDLRQLNDIAGVDQVRKQIVNELDDIFRPYGIRRRNIELLARGVTDTGIVEDPGDSRDLIRGQHVSVSAIRELNGTKLKGKKPVRVETILSGINSAPLEASEDWLAKLNHEYLKESLLDAALQGHVSDISGLNPWSAMSFNERFGEGISKKPGAY